jgi:hypothetical protein
MIADYIKSKGIWGAAIVLLGFLAQHDVAIRVGQDIYPITDVTSVLGAALGIWGRMTAKGPLVGKGGENA